MVVIVIASQMMKQLRMRRRWSGLHAFAGRRGVQRGYATGWHADECIEDGWTVGYTPVVIEAGARIRGWFITIEGPEGAGKTTQASALASHLEAMGVDVHVTREPGGTWLGERLREVLLARTDAAAATDPLTDAFLFNAARRQLVTEVIRPALDGGRTVICARYADSTLAYQGYGAGVPLDRLRALEATATDGLQPDLTILLDLPAEDGLARVAPGDITRFEAEFDLAFHRRVRDGFLALAAADPGRFAVIDARQPAADVAAAVAAAADRSAFASEPRPAGVRTTG
jgi:dTMP kinase